ncbi:Lrp/AsnC family transcriptional regulator [Novosphingobium chloroacetimidivorans]|uniref:Lrp/AsnC family transcriptional regulator n=1 Tax=Novosphingobium chloroacetimidivorans TaxID=1428314 RepID=A0A7W7NUY0_9SPHN|nr:Lrp/AsnC family transcriptional regulator [Novosphingobium chloroacetimidivorans]MBB4857978.1 Lrp/AsnC family transcriptional regulator [Novosphingobium chloroacetimidivorans]
MQKLVNLDLLDRRILVQLQRDASLSNAELAERVGSTGPSVWRRIRQMEDAGVLGATVRLANAASLGQTVNVLCHVRMRDYSAECIEQLESFIRQTERILECYSMSGEWDYVMRIVASDVSDYEQFLMRVMLKHSSIAAASSNFALSVTKYTSAFPVV